MKKITIFYHSGAGATKTLAEIFRDLLSESFEVTLSPVAAGCDLKTLQESDFLVFGFPIYGFDASTSMNEFVEALPRLEEPKPCFLFATMGIYPGAGTRKLADKLVRKNFIATGYAEFPAPASDGALFFPESRTWARRYRRQPMRRLEASVTKIKQALAAPVIKAKLPPGRPLWRLLEKPMLPPALRQVEKYKRGMRVLEDRCSNCGSCVAECSRGAIVQGEDHPEFVPDNCELCFHCVHHCPNRAITFLEGPIDKPRLNEAFFADQKQELLRKKGK